MDPTAKLVELEGFLRLMAQVVRDQEEEIARLRADRAELARELERLGVARTAGGKREGATR